MPDFDDDLITTAFDGFASAAAPAVSVPGTAAVRATVRRRRRLRAAAVGVAAAVLIAAPLIAYGSANRALPPAPPASPEGPEVTSSASPILTPSPSATPAPTTDGIGRITVDELVAANPTLPAWGWAGESCATTGLVAHTDDQGVPYVLTLAYASLDADPGPETAALLHCNQGEIETGQVLVFDRDGSGAIVLQTRLVASTEDFNGLWDVAAAPAGGVYVEVSKRVACCDTPLSAEQHSYRWYFWDGERMIVKPAPLDAPLYSVPDRLFARDPMGHFDASETRGVILPSLCGATYSSDAGVRVRRTMDLPYHTTGTPEGHIPSGAFLHTITTYRRPADAQRFMSELTDAVASCPTETVGGTVRRNRIVPGRSFGQRSLLIEITYDEPPPFSGATKRLVSVFQVDGVVEILYEVGWESSAADAAFVERMAARAEDLLEARLGM